MTLTFDLDLSKSIGLLLADRSIYCSNLVLIGELFFELSSHAESFMDRQMKSHSESDTCRNVTFLLKWGCEIVRNSKIVTYSLYIVPYMIVIQNKGHFRSKGRHFRLKGHHFRWKGHHFRSKVITSSCFTQVWCSCKTTLFYRKARHFRFSTPYEFRNRKCYYKMFNRWI